MHIMPGKVVVSQEPSDVFEVTGIASGIVVVMYEEEKKIGGIAHLLLPSSLPGSGKRASMSAVNTALPCMLEEIKKLGGDPRLVKVKAVGGARLQGASPAASMGERIHEAILKTLGDLGLTLHKRDIGEICKRNVRFQLLDGSLQVQSFKKNRGRESA